MNIRSASRCHVKDSAHVLEHLDLFSGALAQVHPELSPKEAKSGVR